MRKLLRIPSPYLVSLLIIAVVLVFMLEPGQPARAETPDATVHISRSEIYSGGILESGRMIFTAVEDGLIYYREYNSSGTTLERLATAGEQAFYNAEAAVEAEFSAVDAAVANLTGQQEGNPWLDWVNSRSADLTSCEADMTFGQTLDFNSLGVNAQNNTIERMQECIRINSLVNRRTITRLYELLVAEGIIEP